MQEQPKTVNVNISSSTIARIVLTGLLILAVFKLINIVLIVLTAIVLASFVESAVKKIKRIIPNRTFAVFIIYILTIIIIAGLFTVFVPVFVSEMSSLVVKLGNYIPQNSILNSFQPDALSGAKGVAVSLSQNASLADIITSTKTLIQSLSGSFFDIFGKAFGGAFNFFLIIIISFYLSIREKGIEGFLRIVVPANSEEYVIDLWQRTERKIGLWVQGQMLLGLIIGLLAYLGLTIMGVKYSLVLALLTAFFELIPFGIYLSVIPAVVFSYLDGGMTLAFLTALLYLVLHQFETYLIYPLIIKKVIGISPLVVILSILIGAELAGFWGVILAIPTAVCLLEFMNDIEQKKVLARGR
jgi:predicted PurR-regulated permease PerM